MLTPYGMRLARPAKMASPEKMVWTVSRVSAATVTTAHQLSRPANGWPVKRIAAWRSLPMKTIATSHRRKVRAGCRQHVRDSGNWSRSRSEVHVDLRADLANGAAPTLHFLLNNVCKIWKLRFNQPALAVCRQYLTRRSAGGWPFGLMTTASLIWQSVT